MLSGSRSYFAAAEPKEVGRRLVERLKTLTADERGNRQEMASAYAHVFGQDVGQGMTAGVTRGGERGELALLRVNTSNANLNGKHALVTAAQVAWKAQAKNGSAGAAESISKSQDALENEWKSNGLAEVESLWTLRALQFGAHFVFAKWDRSAGPPLGALGDRLITQGAFVYHSVNAWDVFVDNRAKSYRDTKWRFVRLLENRWDLAKQTQRLMDGRSGDAAQQAVLAACEAQPELGVTADDAESYRDSDLVPVWHFFHDPTPALPMGLYVSFVTADTVLRYEPLRGPNATYEGCPLVRMHDKEMPDSPHAWATFWDVLGAQEISDGIHTSLATVATTYGNPILANEKGSGLAPDRIGAGHSVWEYKPGGKAPAYIQSPKVEPSYLEYQKSLHAAIREGIGMNDIAMGQPQTAQMNAQAFAVLASMAQQQASPFQANRIAAIGRLGTVVIKTLAKRVQKPRSFTLPGRSDSVSFSGKDLRNIESISVEIGNPLEQTTAGRQLLLENYLKLGIPMTPEQLMQVQTTGRLDSVSKRPTAEMTLIQQEREMLERGEMPPVHWSHNHVLHFAEGAGAALSASALQSAEVMKVIEGFLDQHYLLQFGVARQADPLALMRERWMLGQALGPGQEMMQPDPNAPAGAPTGGPPPPGGEADMALASPPDVAAMEAAQSAPMPTNPLSGAPFDPSATPAA